MKRNVQLRVADSESSKQFELQEVTESVTWETSLLDQPGKLSFEIVDTFGDVFFEGSNVVLAIDGVKAFDGYVFTRKRTSENKMSVVAFDRLRYLQNKDTKLFQNATAAEIFQVICQDQQLPYKIVASSSYKIPPVVHDNKSFYAMIKHGLDLTLIATGQYLMIRDNVGVLEMVDVANLTTNILVAEDSLLTGFTFETSIDASTYNVIKLTQENKTENTRDVYIVKDSSTIAKWGKLQYTETVAEEATAAQIKERANQLLKLYNRKTKSLEVSCLGNMNVQVGSGVCVLIPKLATEGVAQSQYMFVSKASHKISGEDYTMSLTLEVV